MIDFIDLFILFFTIGKSYFVPAKLESSFTSIAALMLVLAVLNVFFPHSIITRVLSEIKKFDKEKNNKETEINIMILTEPILSLIMIRPILFSEGRVPLIIIIPANTEFNNRCNFILPN